MSQPETIAGAVRLTPALPMTTTNKILERAWRAERWNCAEPVLWQPSKGTPYEYLDDRGVQVLEAAVADRVV